VCSVVENECVLRSRRRGIAAAPPRAGEWEPVVAPPRAARRRHHPDDRGARGRRPWTGSHRNGRDGGRRNGRHGWWHHSEATNLSTRVLLQVNAFFDHRPQAADGFLDGAALPLQNARLGIRPPNNGRGRQWARTTRLRHFCGFSNERMRFRHRPAVDAPRLHRYDEVRRPPRCRVRL
jgi:hypothetical protein